MKTVEFLQGKWLGHPLHPAIVHVPIGAWLAATVIDCVDHDHTVATAADRLALYAVIAGLVGALLAVPTGVADWSSIKKEKPAWKLGLVHMALNLVAAIVWAANLGLRWKSVDTADPVTTAVLATSLIGSGLVLASGYVGSLMVFSYGVSVARHSKQKLRRTAVQAGSRVPESK